MRTKLYRKKKKVGDVTELTASINHNFFFFAVQNIGTREIVHSIPLKAVLSCRVAYFLSVLSFVRCKAAREAKATNDICVIF